jgi:sulfur carrier protein ThiS
MADPGMSCCYDRLMSEAEFRFYEELNDHLPPGRRKRSFVHQFGGRTPVAELIRALGVPLPEVELILVNGDSVAGDHLISDGDRISVYPVFEAFDIAPLVRLRPGPLRRVRFVVDADLHRLGRLLHRLGFDIVSFGDSRESEAHTATWEGRIVLTRKASRLQDDGVTHALLVRARDPQEQLVEVMQRLHLNGGGTGARGS